MPFTFTEVSSRYGAPMGRRETRPFEPEHKLHLERVQFVDGDYDKGGAYWGGGSPLYVAWDEEGVTLFVRARDRKAAKEAIQEEYAGITFHRIPGDRHGHQ